MSVLSHAIQKLPVKTARRAAIVDVTHAIRRAVRAAGVKEGMAIAYIPHTTAAITINENYDPDVKSDLLAKLEAMIPKDETYYRHDEGNSDSHLKTALVGSSVTVLIEGGEVVLGQWQGIQFCEFDGPRDREMWVKIVDFRAKQD